MARRMVLSALACALVLVATTGSTGEEVPGGAGLARAPEVRSASALRPSSSLRPTTSTSSTSTSTTRGPTSTTEALERPARPAPTMTTAVEVPTPAPGPWEALAACESGGDWSSTVGRYDGGLQFLPATWRGAGGEEFAPSADQATPAEQVEVAERVLASQGWGAWPFCSRQLGLR